MKILLTGGSGMVGSNIREHCLYKTHDITSPSSTELNLLDPILVNQYIKDLQPDMIIHTAGHVGGIQANISDPVRFLSDNLLMGMHLVLAAKDAKVPNFMNLGTSCMYPKDIPNPISEDKILSGTLEPTNEGYAIAKSTIAKLCMYISTENDHLNYKTVIPCNLYGRYDNFDPISSHMIPAVIRKMDAAVRDGIDNIDMWGDGTARREFMYTADLADFIMYAVDNFEAMPQNINVGLGIDYSVSDYYEAVALVVGYTGSITKDITKPAGMQQKLMSNTNTQLYGWSPTTSLLEGISHSYNFYKSKQ